MFTYTHTHTHKTCVSSVPCTSVNYLVEILYYTYELLPWGNWVKGTQDHSVLFFVTACKSKMMSKKKV